MSVISTNVERSLDKLEMTKKDIRSCSHGADTLWNVLLRPQKRKFYCFNFVLSKLIHIFVVENGYKMKDVLLTILLCLFAIEVPADSWDEGNFKPYNTEAL